MSEIIDVFLTLVRKLVSQALVVQSFFEFSPMRTGDLTTHDDFSCNLDGYFGI